MEVADMDLYLMQSFMGEFINVYDRQLDELVSCISKIKELDDGILKEHWSGEGRDSFKTKIDEWADSFKGVKDKMNTAKKAVAIMDGDASSLIRLVNCIKITYG